MGEFSPSRQLCYGWKRRITEHTKTVEQSKEQFNSYCSGHKKKNCQITNKFAREKGDYNHIKGSPKLQHSESGRKRSRNRSAINQQYRQTSIGMGQQATTREERTFNPHDE